MVDNGSGPAVVGRLREIPGLRLVLNAGNLGFGPASNQVAAIARGRALVFLNSDAIVTPAGWSRCWRGWRTRPSASSGRPC